MIKEALQYIVGMSGAELHEIDGLQYADRALTPIKPPQPPTLRLSTLESLAADLDEEDSAIIVNPASACILGFADDWERRAVLVEAIAIIPNFSCNGYMLHEQFILWLLTHFEADEERARLLSFAGNIRTESVATSEDERGAKLRQEGWQNPVTLAPFRTFDEIEQPKSKFIFRIREDLQMGLFSVEDNAWKLEAMRSIRDHLITLGVKLPIYL